VTDFHEGDMADTIVDYIMTHMSFNEVLERSDLCEDITLTEISVSEVYTLAEASVAREVKSWPTDVIRWHYTSITGEST